MLGIDRPLKPGRLERSLVVAWESGATPVVIVSKIDLVTDDGSSYGSSTSAAVAPSTSSGSPSTSSRRRSSGIACRSDSMTPTL